MNFIAAATGASREAAEIVALKAQLAKAQAALAKAQADPAPFAAEAAAAADIAAANSEPFVGEQTMEQTAAGVAFFNNDLDAEDAVVALDAHRRAAEEAAGGIALPAGCDMDADFGAAPSGDGWGSDDDGAIDAED